MRRTIVRSLAVTFIAAFLACTQDGRAATDTVAKGQAASAAPSAPSATPLFRDAADVKPTPQQSQAAEASVPAQNTLAPLIERLKPAVVNISTTTVVKHPPIARGPGRRNPRGPQQGPQGEDDFQDFFE